MKYIRSLIYELLLRTRQSPLRRPLLGLFIRLHNFSYHMTSFFSSHTGIHPKHKILNYHQFFIDNISSTDTILDIGSGNGAVAYDAAKKAKHVVGIDFSSKNIHQSKKTYQTKNLKFIEGDATTYEFDAQFDVIILSNVLEHIEHRIKFLQKISAIAPKILIRVPMLTRDWITIYKKQEGYEYRLDATHYIEYSEDVFREEILKANLHIQHLYTKFGELYAVVTRYA